MINTLWNSESDRNEIKMVDRDWFEKKMRFQRKLEFAYALDNTHIV